MNNQVHDANFRNAFVEIGSKKKLQHQKTLNKYMNANNSHSIMVPSHIWHHNIHLLHEGPLGLHTHNQSVIC